MTGLILRLDSYTTAADFWGALVMQPIERMPGSSSFRQSLHAKSLIWTRCWQKRLLRSSTKNWTRHSTLLRSRRKWAGLHLLFLSTAALPLPSTERLLVGDGILAMAPPAPVHRSRILTTRRVIILPPLL